MSAAKQFRVEMSEGQSQRLVDADTMSTADGWLIFHRKPPGSTASEYWRVALRCVVSVETVAKARGATA